MRKARLLLACTTVLLLAPAGQSLAGQRSRERCPASGRQPAVSDGRAQVYEEDGRVFGCAQARGRWYALGGYTEVFGGEHLEPAVLAGTTVVVEHVREGRRWIPGDPLLVVTDLLTGRVLRKVHTGGPPLGGCPACDGRASALALKPDGSLAWIVQDGYPYRTELREADRTGSRTLAAGGYGDEVEEPSLSVDGDVLHWTQGGLPYSAPFD